MIIGYTTASAAAGAAKAAAWMLLFKKQKSMIEIETPRGLMHATSLIDIRKGDSFVSCAVKKDGGVEPDIFDALIYAKVELVERSSENIQIEIECGDGIGNITISGLEIPVGEKAIYPSAIKMIEKEVTEVVNLADMKCKLRITLWVPGGEDIANLKYNPRMGIAGGVRIYGEKKIIEPMNMDSIAKSIYLELNQRHELGFRYVALTTGEYGRAYYDRVYRYEILNKCVKCVDLIGNAIDIAKNFGFKAIIITGNIERIIKIAGGIMNTHSTESDSRLEILASAAIKEGADEEVANDILDSKSLNGAIELLTDEDIFEQVMSYIIDKVIFYVKKRMEARVDVECIIFSETGEEPLVKSGGADRWLTLLAQEVER